MNALLFSAAILKAEAGLVSSQFRAQGRDGTDTIVVPMV